MTDINALIALCTERAEGYGALRQSSTTAIALDRAAEALRTLQARVGELTEVVAWVAQRSTTEEAIRGGASEFAKAATPEDRLKLIGERKREHDEIVLRARTLTSQEVQHHG